MAHFAEINLENNEVLRVIVVSDIDVTNNGGEKSIEIEQWVKLNHPEDPIIKENFFGLYPKTYWKQTSYNTHGGKYYDQNLEIHEDQSKSFRKNYARIGFIYNQDIDGFTSPKPFNSWILNNNTGFWEPPVVKPNDEQEYYWNEENLNWSLVI
jgi:hypothetical protein